MNLQAKAWTHGLTLKRALISLPPSPIRLPRTLHIWRSACS